LAEDTNRSGFLRHIRDCQNARLPGGRLPFRLGGTQVGWVRPPLTEALAGFPAVRSGAGGVTLDAPETLPDIARTLSERKLYRWRNEAFDVRAAPDGPVLARIDRGAIPSFGILSVGVHVNGLVRRPDGLHLWVGRRAAHKALDPNKLDHIVAGGVPAGLTPEQTLEKEAGEEAAIPPALIRHARRAARIAYAMERPEGLRRDCLFCYDLDVPEDFVPHPNDDEVAVFELWPVVRVLAAVRDSDAFKFNVNLVLIDLFLREGLIAGPDAVALREALAAGKV
jgi:8-oxo-dGTP pyrophosphatase MutT (NUDIX family)